MIYRIDVRNPKDEVLTLDLYAPQKSGLNVKNITGISPVGADIFMTPFASIDGAVYAGSRVPSRNIVMTIGMWNEEDSDGTIASIEDARLKSYNFFRIKDPVNLVFYTSNRILQVTGYVESNEVDIFSEDETTTISIICVDPWFHSESKTEIGFSGTRPTFEFPFQSVEGGTTYPDLLQFGYISIDTRTNIIYKGDIKVGFEMHISFLGSEFHNIYFYNMDTRERMNMYTDQIEVLTGSPLDTGDELYISTVSGQRSAYLLRNGIFTNVISMIDKNADWFQLTKGSNMFAFASDHGVENITISLSYQDAYGGI